MFRIKAIRSSISVFGVGCAWVKEDGRIQEFATRAEAEAVADSYRKRLTTLNVSYMVEEV